MRVLLDSNVFISALLLPHSAPAQIVRQWLEDRFEILTCQQQIDEIRLASRYPKFRQTVLHL